MPIVSSQTFTNTGQPYDTHEIVTNGIFDVEKYRNYSPVFISVALALNYGLSFAATTSAITHTYLWYGRDIMRQLRANTRDQRDIHSRLMSRYRDIPHWWFGAIFVACFTLGAIATLAYDTNMPFWAYLLAVIFPVIFILPLGILLAITGQYMFLNVVSELIGGYIIPGRPIAVMIFKVYATTVTKQALECSSNLKLGHYIKVPPRIMVLSQTIAITISCIVSVAVQRWMLTNIEDICQPGQKNGFVCPTSNVFAEASLLFGGIGPSRMFGAGQMYVRVLRINTSTD